MNAMVDLSVTTVPAKLETNFETIRQALAAQLEEYNVVVTADTVKDAKELAIRLNKLKGEIDARRKEETAKASAPIREFDEKMKELTGMCQEGRQKILDQVKRFEDETRDLCQKLLEEKREALWSQHNIDAEFKAAEFDDLVKLTSVTKKKNLTKGACDELEKRVLQDKAMMDRVQMRLVDLENRSYRADLAAPLTRHHVEPFLRAKDEVYERELTRILDAEIERQRVAEQRAHERAQREQESIAAAEREKRDREARLAEQEQRQEQAPQPVAEEPAAQEQQPAPEVDVTTAASRDAASDPVCTVTATFAVPIPNGVSDEQVESALRAKMEAAGFTTLQSIKIDRAPF